MNLHDDENRAGDDTLDAAAKNRVSDNGEGLVDNHVRQQQGDEQQVAILANGLDLVGVYLLFTAIY